MTIRLRVLIISAFCLGATLSHAHFQALIPDKSIVEVQQQEPLALLIAFLHPFEQHGMDMAKPDSAGVCFRGKKTDLLPTLTPIEHLGHKAWSAHFDLARPGDYIFYVSPTPYWEPSEGKFIVHHTKVVVSAFGAEEGWDVEVGLPAEIIPLSRPYGLYAGNVFSGVVKMEGRPAANIAVEVEYLNSDSKPPLKAPAMPFVTQVTTTDVNGVFHFAMPAAGWWGFAALGEASQGVMKDGELRPVELGAVMWVKTEEWPKAGD